MINSAYSFKSLPSSRKQRSTSVNFKLRKTSAKKVKQNDSNNHSREEQIKEVVRIRERPSKRINEVAWIDGFNVIYVNPQPFYSLTKEKQVSTLLHEFIHLLHSSRKFLFFNKFPEVKKLTKSLYIIVKNGLTQGSTLGSFIANRKDVSLKYLNKEEILAYLMTGSINWNAITKEAKEKVIQELKDSNMFNLTSNFWIKRLK